MYKQRTHTTGGETCAVTSSIVISERARYVDVTIRMYSEAAPSTYIAIFG